MLGIKSKDRYMSYLPIAHGMERWIGMVRIQLCYLSSGDLLSRRRFSFVKQANLNLVLFSTVHSNVHWNANLVCRGPYYLYYRPQPLRAHSIFVGPSVSHSCMCFISSNSRNLALLFIFGASQTYIISIV